MKMPAPLPEDMVKVFGIVASLRLLGVFMSPAADGSLVFEPELSPENADPGAYLAARPDMALAAQAAVEVAVMTAAQKAAEMRDAVLALRAGIADSEHRAVTQALALEHATSIGWPFALLLAQMSSLGAVAPASPLIDAESLHVGQYL
jgi:hypothetical protein